MSELLDRARAALDAYRAARKPEKLIRAIECALLVPELIAEVERLQRVTDIIDPDSVYREQRDEARARLAALEQAVARVRELAAKWKRIASDPMTGINTAATLEECAAQLNAALDGTEAL